MNILVNSLIVAALISAQPYVYPSAAQQDNARDSKDVVISLERTMCQGVCPAYEVSMSGDGQVRYVGHANVGRKGEHYGSVDPKVVRNLTAEAERINFLALKTCDSKVVERSVDAPRIYVAVTLHGEKKTISYVWGGKCPELKTLPGFADKIDKALKSVHCR